MSTYDFSTLYTTLPHNLIKDKLIDLIERTFQREGSPYLACNDRNAFFTFQKPKKYLDDILNIKYVYFDNMVGQIYPSDVHLNKVNTSDTEAAFLDLHLSISNDIVSTKIYDKRGDFDF